LTLHYRAIRRKLKMCTGTRPVAIQKSLTTLKAPLGPAKYSVRFQEKQASSAWRSVDADGRRAGRDVLRSR